MRQILDELRPFGTRADEAHVPLEHVPELRQLIEARFPQKTPNRGDTGIVCLRPDRAGLRFGVHAHRAELVHHEMAIAISDAHLMVERRPPGREAYGCRDDEHDWRGENESADGSKDVDPAFYCFERRRSAEP